VGVRTWCVAFRWLLRSFVPIAEVAMMTERCDELPRLGRPRQDRDMREPLARDKGPSPMMKVLCAPSPGPEQVGAGGIEPPTSRSTTGCSAN
jgi:hypothetical protein